MLVEAARPWPMRLVLFLLYVFVMAWSVAVLAKRVDDGRLAAHPRWALTLMIVAIPVPLGVVRLAARTARIARVPAARRTRLGDLLACWGRTVRSFAYFGVFVAALLLSSMFPADMADPRWLHLAADVVLLVQVGVWLGRTIVRLRHARIGDHLQEAIAELRADWLEPGRRDG